jgi:deoxyribonuclease IV
VIFGAHCSGGVKGALEKAIEIGADAVQLFVQSPRTWHFPEHDPAVLERFRSRRAETELGSVLVHSLYLCNLAAPDRAVYSKSVQTMRSTMETSCAIGADGVVFHVGSHLGSGFEAGLERVLPALEQVLERCSDTTWLLIENSAGTGGTIGRSLDELAVLVDRAGGHPRLGICLDSCHLWASGYDVTDAAALEAVLDEVDEKIGLDRLRALHVNDSATPLGSNRDRHANILEGLMDKRLGVFLANSRLQHLPVILEVPGRNGKGPDAEEVGKLRDLWRRARRSAGPARRRGSSARRVEARGTPG